MSKQLILLRHARADWQLGQHCDDLTKPLNPLGEKQAPTMGTILRDRDINPQLMISSPANRAITTARIVAEYIGFAKTDIQEERRIYENTLDDVLQVIQEIDNSYERVMLVGHNPSFSLLANTLCPEASISLPACGVCQIELNCEHWLDIGECQGSCLTYQVEE